ncbi:MAG: hypothetical protein WBA76_16145 [Phormidesmis sp.]
MADTLAIPANKTLTPTHLGIRALRWCWLYGGMFEEEGPLEGARLTDDTNNPGL